MSNIEDSSMSQSYLHASKKTPLSIVLYSIQTDPHPSFLLYKQQRQRYTNMYICMIGTEDAWPRSRVSRNWQLPNNWSVTHVKQGRYDMTTALKLLKRRSVLAHVKCVQNHKHCTLYTVLFDTLDRATNEPVLVFTMNLLMQI